MPFDRFPRKISGKPCKLLSINDADEARLTVFNFQVQITVGIYVRVISFV